LRMSKHFACRVEKGFVTQIMDVTKLYREINDLPQDVDFKQIESALQGLLDIEFVVTCVNIDEARIVAQGIADEMSL
jgi:hypothetical protein